MISMIMYKVIVAPVKHYRDDMVFTFTTRRLAEEFIDGLTASYLKSTLDTTGELWDAVTMERFFRERCSITEVEFPVRDSQVSAEEFAEFGETLYLES